MSRADRKLLTVNRRPLKIVPDAVRAVWFKRPAPYRCEICGSDRAKLEETSGQSDVAKFRWRCVNRRGCARRFREDWAAANPGLRSAAVNRSTAARIRAAEDAIRAAGWDLRYVRFVEDGDTPGIWPGLYAGATDPRKREVKIRPEVRSVILAEVLEHELHHVRDFEAGIPAGEHSWCGNHFTLDGLTVGSQVKDPGRARRT